MNLSYAQKMQVSEIGSIFQLAVWSENGQIGASVAKLRCLKSFTGPFLYRILFFGKFISERRWVVFASTETKNMLGTINHG